MLTELLRKGGCLCQPAREGTLRCPLIVRPTSEDVVTGNLFGVLKVINPRWWLPDFLNEGLGVTCFHRQVFRDLKIDLWQNKPCYPREFLPWEEGSTQVDCTLTWENPPTTVYIEMKYGIRDQRRKLNAKPMLSPVLPLNALRARNLRRKSLVIFELRKLGY